MIPKSPNKLKNILKKIIKKIGNLIIVFFVASILIVLFYKRINPPISNFMIFRLVGKVVNLEKPHLKKSRIKIENIDKDILYGSIAGEDQNFLDHFGF